MHANTQHTRTHVASHNSRARCRMNIHTHRETSWPRRRWCFLPALSCVVVRMRLGARNVKCESKVNTLNVCGFVRIVGKQAIAREADSDSRSCTVHMVACIYAQTRCSINTIHRPHTRRHKAQHTHAHTHGLHNISCGIPSGKFSAACACVYCVAGRWHSHTPQHNDSRTPTYCLHRSVRV